MKELQPLYELIDYEMNAKARAAGGMGAQEKPGMQTNEPFAMGTPTHNKMQPDLRHPVIQKRSMVDDARAQGDDVISAHEKVYGQTNMGDITSKAGISSTLGRVQDDSFKTNIQLEPEKGSILSKDFEAEKAADQVTPDDMHTPMRGQVPDDLQTPGENAAIASGMQQEELEIPEEYDYNLDVAYLQQYGRA